MALDFDTIYGRRQNAFALPLGKSRVVTDDFIGSAPRTRRQIRTTRRSAVSLLVGADALAVGMALVLGQFAIQAEQHQRDLATVALTSIYVPVFIVVIGCYGLYHRPQRRLVGSSFPDIGRIVHSLFVACLLTLFLSGVLHRLLQVPYVDRPVALVSGATALFTIGLCRMAIRLIVKPDSTPSNVLVVGSGQVAALVVARLKKVDGVSVVGCVDEFATDCSDYDLSDAPRLGTFSELTAVIDHWKVDHLIVAFSLTNEAALAAELRRVPGHIRISVVPRMFDLLTIRSNIDDLRGLPIVDVAPPALGTLDRILKRSLDVAVSASVLLLLSPLLLLIGVLIKGTSHGSVFFLQYRSGRDGKPFRILKFRTMYEGSDRLNVELANDVDGPLFKAHDDPRITPIGRVLRKLSFDEFPQLINVLIGDMSLVGPRPFVLPEAAQINGWAARRFDVRPGMTGMWQVSGRNDLPFEELCRLDYLYVASWSLWWDLSILWKTPGRVLHRDGAY